MNRYNYASIIEAGRLVEEIWVFGAMERGLDGGHSGNFFIQKIANRNENLGN